MNKNAITVRTQATPLAVVNDLMKQAGKAANKAARSRVFSSALSGKAKNTDRRKRADLALFETFLNGAGVPAGDLYENPEAWRGVTWGIVEAFKTWQLSQGYAIASINGRLSTVRSHATLAVKAGAIAESEGRMIASVKGYRHKEVKHIDAKRRADGFKTRMGAKKSQSVTIPEDIAETLINQPDTPQGRRDALLMCLLLQHGLRVSEIAVLTAKAFDLKANTLTFYRPKVDLTQTHELTPDARRASQAYLKHDAPNQGTIWRKSHKGTMELSGQLSEASATRSLTKRVEFLGRKAGIKGLSAHDARHFWATYEARKGTPIDRLKDAGGWSSPAMPLRYIEAAKIANEGTARVSKRS